jgi:hypothetical protein
MAQGTEGGGDNVVPIRPDTRTPSGGGPNDPGLEPRVAKLEAYVERIYKELEEIKSDIREIKRDARSDFRQLFGAIIIVALGLAGLMAKGFHWIGG